MDRRTFLATAAASPLASLPTFGSDLPTLIDYRLEGRGTSYMVALNSDAADFLATRAAFPDWRLVWLRPAREGRG